MKKRIQSQAEQTLSVFVHGYMIFTLAALLLLFPVGPLPLPGSNALYDLFVSLMLFPEMKPLVSAIFALLILLTMFAYPISLLVSYILALVKKWYRLFGILMGINIPIVACVTLAVVITNRMAPPLVMAADIIINTFYTIYYFRLHREFAREQTAPLPTQPTEPAPAEPTEPEQSPQQ